MFNTRVRRNYALEMILMVAVVVTFLGQPLCAQSVDLSGTWDLNVQDSDDLRAKFQSAMARARAVGDGGGGARGGGAPGGGGGTPGGGGGAGQAPTSLGNGGSELGGGIASSGGMGAIQAMEQGIERLVIRQTEPEVVVDLANGARRVFRTDGSVPEGLPAGYTVEPKWKKGKLVVKIKPGESAAPINQKYELDKGRLVVTTGVPGRGGQPSITYKRVYDPADS